MKKKKNKFNYVHLHFVEDDNPFENKSIKKNLIYDIRQTIHGHTSVKALFCLGFHFMHRILNKCHQQYAHTNNDDTDDDDDEEEK